MSIPFAVLPKEEGVYKGDETGDSGEVETDTCCSILCFRRSTDGESLMLKHETGLGHRYASFLFDKYSSLIMSSCGILLMKYSHI